MNQSIISFIASNMKSIMFNKSKLLEFDYSFMEEEEEEEEDDDIDVNDFDLISHRPQKNYSVFTPSELRKLQEDEITTVSSILSLSKAEAMVLLLHHKWSVSKVNDAWFSDEAKVRNFVGLFQNPVFQSSNTQNLILCGICLEDCEIHDMHSVSCGHVFCRECWKSYISVSINDGCSCLYLKCPKPSCRAAVDWDMIDEFAKKEEKDKFGVFLLSSYVEVNRKMKWCPAPGCEFVIEFCGGIEECNYDIACLCSHRFCWKCDRESHRLVDCDTVSKWDIKNKIEIENTTWIVLNTKPCPKCKRPIEKNQGCISMQCRAPCHYRFCWICLRPISERHLATCNGYPSANIEIAKKRNKAKEELKKYTHYFIRWENNRRSKLKAVEDLELLKTNKIERLNKIYRQPICALSFLNEAWLQIIESRRILQWSYAYGFYLPEKEKEKKQFFEYLQGQAELVIERLHFRVEHGLLQFLKTNISLERFSEFRTKVIGLTKVTETHFKNLVRALENGLEEVKATGGGRRR